LSKSVIFDKFKDRYLEWFKENRVIFENEVRLVNALITYRGKLCLDLGVGPGFFSKELGCSTGLDPSRAMVEIARKLVDNVVLATAESLPFKANSLKTVIIVVTLCFLDDPHRALVDVFNSLEEDGEVIICIIPRNSRWARVYRRLSRRGHPFYSYARFYDVDEVVKLLEDTGFKVKEVKATLRHSPWVRSMPDKPVAYRGTEGFACIKGVKS